MITKLLTMLTACYLYVTVLLLETDLSNYLSKYFKRLQAA